jgi:hypothetical protein
VTGKVRDPHNTAFFVRDFVMNDVSNLELHEYEPQNKELNLGLRKRQQYHCPLGGAGQVALRLSLPLCG